MNPEADPSPPDDEDWLELLEEDPPPLGPYQFGLRGLLLATAILGIYLCLERLLHGGFALGMLVLLALTLGVFIPLLWLCIMMAQAVRNITIWNWKWTLVLAAMGLLAFLRSMRIL